MSAQNRYRTTFNYKSRETEEWAGWKNSAYWWETADNWQDAIQEWIDYACGAAPDEYTVVSETPSEGGKSGIIEIQFDPPHRFLEVAKIKATPIDY